MFGKTERVSHHSRELVDALVTQNEPQWNCFCLLEVFTCDFSFRSEVLVDVDEQGGDDTEQQSESENDSVSDP